MTITPELQARILSDAERIRDTWNAGDHVGAKALLRIAHRYTLQWLQISRSAAPELKLAIQQEHLQRAYDAEG